MPTWFKALQEVNDSSSTFCPQSRHDMAQVLFTHYGKGGSSILQRDPSMKPTLAVQSLWDLFTLLTIFFLVSVDLLLAQGNGPLQPRKRLTMN